MFNFETSDPAVILIVACLFALLGFGGRGFWIRMRQDRRLGKVDDVALLDEVRKVAREEVAYMRTQMSEERNRLNAVIRQERRERERVENYVDILRETLRARGIPVPDWPPAALRVAGDDGTEDR